MTETDDTVYRITIEHRSQITPTMAFSITHSEKIEGRQQAEKVADWLREQGFEPDIAVHHEETSAREVIEKFKRHLHDWPVMREAKLSADEIRNSNTLEARLAAREAMKP